MSLLMDALRKAEEAKRHAAQKQKEDSQPETETPVSEPTPVEDSNALEDVLIFDQGLDSDFTVPTPPEAASEPIVNEEEVFDFDFEIDENFSLEADATEANLGSDTNDSSDMSSVDTIEFAPTDSAVEADSEQSTSEQSEQEIDYLQPNEISRFANLGKSTKPAPQEPDWTDENDNVDEVVEKLDQSEVPKPSSFEASGLTLEERAPSIERPSIIADEINNASDLNAESEQVPAKETVPEAEVIVEAVEPIRAVRDEDKEKESVEKSTVQTPASKTTKPVTPKFAEESRKRESARAVFSAKHKAKDNGSRNKLIAAAALIALLPLGGGVYLLLKTMGVFPSGNQYNIPADYIANAPLAQDLLETGIAQESALRDLSPEPSIVPAAEPEQVIAQSLATVEETPEVESVPEPEPELPIAIQSPTIAESPAVFSEGTEAAIAQSIAADDVVDELNTETTAQTATPAPTPINITRTENTDRVDPLLTQAYASYRSNDFNGARARYQQVLREKPNNRDAMLGLAAVAMHLGDATSARDSYIKLLELDPRDVHARVGLLETMPASDPVMLESELRALFASHPEVAQLPFALGNHFAAQRRWSEAQESYYDALLAAKANGNGPISPDYAFNLAVSLERLNQQRPAYTFYREALEQSKLLTPGFDIRILRERLDALERVL